MKTHTCTSTLLLVILFIGLSLGSSIQRQSRRVHLPFLGLGPYCAGCPMHFCDDDPAIIHGYCCGCASMFDKLPVRCTSLLSCPINGQQLCQDYEYMMHCCCEGK